MRRRAMVMRLATNHAGTLTFSTANWRTEPLSLRRRLESQNGDVPVYASLYGNTGLLLGWINLANLEAAPPANTLTWIKKASRSPLLYTNGFTNTAGGAGRALDQPPAKTPAIILPEGQLVVSNANLFLPFNVSVSNNNALVKLAGSSDQFVDRFDCAQDRAAYAELWQRQRQEHHARIGAILQSQTNGGGFFLGTTNAGFISLLPAQ